MECLKMEFTLFNISLKIKRDINLLIDNGIISAESGLRTMQEISEYQEKFLNKAKENLIGAENYE